MMSKIDHLNWILFITTMAVIAMTVAATVFGYLHAAVFLLIIAFALIAIKAIIG